MNEGSRKFPQSTGTSFGSLTLKLGHAINKYMTNKRGKALREYDQVLLQDMDNLEKLMGSEWSDNISYHSLGTVNKRNLTSQIFSQLLKTWRC